MHIHLECNLRSFEYANLDEPHLLLRHCAGWLANMLPSFARCSLLYSGVMQDYNAQVETGGQKRFPSFLEPGLGANQRSDSEICLLLLLLLLFLFVLFCFINLQKEKSRSHYYVALLPFAFTPASSREFGRIVGSCVINQIYQTDEKHIRPHVWTVRTAENCA